MGQIKNIKLHIVTDIKKVDMLFTNALRRLPNLTPVRHASQYGQKWKRGEMNALKGARIIKDPAIERWNHLRENSAPHFKLTWTSARSMFVWVVAIPYAIYCSSYVAFDVCEETRRPTMAEMDAHMKEHGIVDPLPPRKRGVAVPDILPPGNAPFANYKILD